MHGAEAAQGRLWIEIAARHDRLLNGKVELHNGISETVGIGHIGFYAGVHAFVCGGAYANC